MHCIFMLSRTRPCNDGIKLQYAHLAGARSGSDGPFRFKLTARRPSNSTVELYPRLSQRLWRRCSLCDYYIIVIITMIIIIILIPSLSMVPSPARKRLGNSSVTGKGWKDQRGSSGTANRHMDGHPLGGTNPDCHYPFPPPHLALAHATSDYYFKGGGWGEGRVTPCRSLWRRRSEINNERKI